VEGYIMTEQTTETQTTEPTTPADDGKAALRQQLSTQGQQYQSRIAELEAENTAFKEAQAAKEKTALEEQGKYKELSDTYQQKIADLEKQAEDLKAAQTLSKLDSALRDAGIDNEYTRKGVSADYDGKAPMEEFIATLKNSKPTLFEASPQPRATGAVGTVSQGPASAATADLAAGYKRGDSEAIAEVEKLSKNGQLDDAARKALGL
jgi:vacuolar-type H+-ATPase subunit I/STV1